MIIDAMEGFSSSYNNYPSQSHQSISLAKKELSIYYKTQFNAIYKERNQDLIKLYDSIRGENIFRVYPEKIFCNKLIDNRCVANSKNKIYYFDNDHPSLEGSKLINEDVMEIINYIISKEIN